MVLVLREDAGDPPPLDSADEHLDPDEFVELGEGLAPQGGVGADLQPVSYTHLDVYKRQSQRP